MNQIKTLTRGTKLYTFSKSDETPRLHFLNRGKALLWGVLLFSGEDVPSEFILQERSLERDQQYINVPVDKIMLDTPQFLERKAVATVNVKAISPFASEKKDVVIVDENGNIYWSKTFKRVIELYNRRGGGEVTSSALGFSDPSIITGRLIEYNIDWSKIIQLVLVMRHEGLSLRQIKDSFAKEERTLLTAGIISRR